MASAAKRGSCLSAAVRAISASVSAVVGAGSEYAFDCREARRLCRRVAFYRKLPWSGLSGYENQRHRDCRRVLYRPAVVSTVLPRRRLCRGTGVPDRLESTSSTLAISPDGSMLSLSDTVPLVKGSASDQRACGAFQFSELADDEPSCWLRGKCRRQDDGGWIANCAGLHLNTAVNQSKRPRRLLCPWSFRFGGHIEP